MTFKVCGLNPLKRISVEASSPREAAIIYSRGMQVYGNIFVNDGKRYYRFKTHCEDEGFILDL